MSRIASHIPYYKAQHTHSHSYRWEDYVDRMGNKMKLKYCTYFIRSKKTKKDEMFDVVIQVLHLE